MKNSNNNLNKTSDFNNENKSNSKSNSNSSKSSFNNNNNNNNITQNKKLLNQIIFGGRFQCKNNLLIGSGSFGEIYIGIDTILREYVAVKLEKIQNLKETQLKNEKNILELLNDTEGFPNLYDFGAYNNSFYIAIQRKFEFI